MLHSKSFWVTWSCGSRPWTAVATCWGIRMIKRTIVWECSIYRRALCISVKSEDSSALDCWRYEPDKQDCLCIEYLQCFLTILVLPCKEETCLSMADKIKGQRRKARSLEEQSFYRSLWHKFHDLATISDVGGDLSTARLWKAITRHLKVWEGILSFIFHQKKISAQKIHGSRIHFFHQKIT